MKIAVGLETELLYCIHFRRDWHPMGMPRTTTSWLARRIELAVRAGLSGAYKNIKVDPAKYLLHLRRAYALPVESVHEMRGMPLSLLEHIADRTIAASMKFALAEGAGLGVGGMLTIVPDVGVLTSIAIRMIQRLSLIYGFEYSTEDEVAELWLAAASAAGLDLGREVFEKEVVERFVPRVIERIAVKAGSEVAEKWAARLVPVVSAVLGGALNYYFIRGWGRRAQRHFRERHLVVREHSQIELPPASKQASGQIIRVPSAD
jgi:uncharacterized protein (DUF697 family)